MRTTTTTTRVIPRSKAVLAADKKDLLFWRRILHPPWTWKRSVPHDHDVLEQDPDLADLLEWTRGASELWKKVCLDQVGSTTAYRQSDQMSWMAATK